MGGFMINGCGAADSYYQLKFLETRQCSCCKKPRSFSLMELKMKIRVIFIPTVTINKRYAIVCESCKNGFFVEEAQKDAIMHGTLIPVIADDGISFIDRNALANNEATATHEQIPSPVNQSVNGVAASVPEPVKTFEAPVIKASESFRPVETPAVNIPEPSKPVEAPAVNIPEPMEAPVKEAEATEPAEVEAETEIKQSVNEGFVRSVIKVCPDCKMLYTSGVTNCPVCGETLVERK